MEYDFDNTFSQAPALAANEIILWRGKPQRKGFVATRSLSLLPIALIWLVLDLSILMPALGQGEMLGFLIPFFALHMMPVWIWLGNVFTAGKRWKNTAYYATNRRLIIQTGYLAVNETSVFYKDIRNTQVRIGLLDKMFGTGDILIDDGYYRSKNRTPTHMFEDLENPQQVYNRIQKIILDIQTDMEFPNAYRPAENPGYNTQYEP